MSALKAILLSKPTRSRRPATRVLSRQYHMHSGGVFYVLITVLLGIGSINSQNNLLFIVFGVALGTMLVSGAVSGAMMMGLQIERRPVSPVPAGSYARLSYTIRNTRRRVPAMAIHVIEASRPQRKRKRRDRAVRKAEAFVDVVPPGQGVDVSAVLPCNRRGVVKLDPITISTTFPFGIVLKSITVTQPAEFVVLPKVIDLAPSVLLSGRSRGRTEIERPDRRGLGLEFYSIREYQPGDPMRRIAWKQSARSGTLRTREFAAPVATAVMLELVLERETLPSTDSDGERAIAFAASLSALAARLDIAAGLSVPQLGLTIPPNHNQGRTAAMLEALARIDLNDERFDSSPASREAPADARLLRVQSLNAPYQVPGTAEAMHPEQHGEAIS